GLQAGWPARHSPGRSGAARRRCARPASVGGVRRGRARALRRYRMALMEADAAARLVFEEGPLTRAEIKKLPNDRAYEYFQLMNSFVRELGEAGFRARRAELREAVLRKIVNR